MTDKSSIAFLLKYLTENTDEEHPVSSAELRGLLRKKGYPSDPRTIRKDIDMLREVGYDIMIIGQNGLATSYFYGGQEWDKAELRILIDAVSSARFITPERSRKIIRKLAGLAGNQNRKELVPDLFVSERVKAQSNQLLYCLERISSAIRQKKKIVFKYYNYNTAKKRIHRHGGETYTLSPYATLWEDDRYYVVGWSDKREDVVAFRLDRMPVPKISDEDAVPPPKGFSLQDYSDKVTRMYGGQTETVTLHCRSGMMDQVIDKFGLDVEITGVTQDSFDATVTVAVGGTFLSWVFQFAGQIFIKGPDSVRQLYEEMLQTARHDMSLNDFSEVSERVWKL